MRVTAARNATASAAAGGLCVLVALAACDPVSREVRAEVERMVVLTVPASAVLSREPVVVHDHSGVRATWTVTTDTAWSGYAGVLERAVTPRYGVASRSDAALVLRRPVEGDVWQLDVQRIAAGPPLVVRITLRGSPN